MKTDIEIAQETLPRPIAEVAAGIGISGDDLNPYGKYKAKLSQELVDRVKSAKDGKLILVTAINPTPAGEGKTTTTIGLGQAMKKIGKKCMITLREPSLGPCFGMKGGATGGGYSQALPMEDINLHFTGDFHAITSAHNLISAMLDNHIFQGNELNIDINNIKWKRVVDLNDRALRNITVHMNGKKSGESREDGYMITVASEIMAIFCLAADMDDLRERVGRIVVAYNIAGDPVTVKNLKAVGAVLVLLKDALQPNIVQTIEGLPALIHGGPFANIAHGCNSVIATKTALKLADYVITEAGFGADLGAEKFMDIKCRVAGLRPDAVVIVATVRALKYNGGVARDNLATSNLEAVREGFGNLQRHVENLKKYGIPVVVTLNRFTSDSDEELGFIREQCQAMGADFALSEVWAKGGEGGIELAETVLRAMEKPSEFRFLYELNAPIREKIETIAKEIYRASNVKYSKKAIESIAKIEEMGMGNLLVCMAKTQYSFSDDKDLLGAPTNFDITINDVNFSAGAGFVVALAGNIMTMPGLPKKPAAENMDVVDGKITGLF